MKNMVIAFTVAAGLTACGTLTAGPIDNAQQFQQKMVRQSVKKPYEQNFNVKKKSGNHLQDVLNDPSSIVNTGQPEPTKTDMTVTTEEGAVQKEK